MGTNRDAVSAVINALYQKYSGSKAKHFSGLKGAAIASAILVLLTTSNPSREQVSSKEVIVEVGEDQTEFANEINRPAIPGNFWVYPSFPKDFTEKIA